MAALHADQVRAKILSHYFQHSLISRPAFDHTPSRIVPRIYMTAQPGGPAPKQYDVTRLSELMQGNGSVATLRRQQRQKQPRLGSGIKVVVDHNTGNKDIGMRVRALASPLLDASMAAEYIAQQSQSTLARKGSFQGAFRQFVSSFHLRDGPRGQQSPFTGVRLAVKGRLQKSRGAGRAQRFREEKGNVKVSTVGAPTDYHMAILRSREGIVSHKVWIGAKPWNLARTGAVIDGSHVRKLRALKSER